MVIFPIVAAGVSVIFATILFRQFATKHRVQHLAWGVAMAMFTVASLMVAIGVGRGWSPGVYRIYYLFGAMLNVPWLALGSVALLNKRVLTALMIAIVAAMSLWGIIKIVSGRTCGAVVGPQRICAELNPDPAARVFGRSDIPSGKNVWASDNSVRTLAILYSTAAYVVVIGLGIWSSRAHKGLRPARDRVRANLLIAIGVTIVAVGSTALERYARGAVFSVMLALGVIVMFIGFLFASRAPRFNVEEPGESPT